MPRPKKQTDLPIRLHLDDMAVALDLTPRQVTSLAKAGTLQRSADGTFDLIESLRAYGAYKAPGDPEKRTAEAKAALLEQRLARETRRLVPFPELREFELRYLGPYADEKLCQEVAVWVANSMDDAGGDLWDNVAKGGNARRWAVRDFIEQGLTFRRWEFNAEVAVGLEKFRQGQLPDDDMTEEEKRLEAEAAEEEEPDNDQ
jgi:hypothetical protein